MSESGPQSCQAQSFKVAPILGAGYIKRERSVVGNRGQRPFKRHRDNIFTEGYTLLRVPTRPSPLTIESPTKRAADESQTSQRAERGVETMYASHMVIRGVECRCRAYSHRVSMTGEYVVRLSESLRI